MGCNHHDEVAMPLLAALVAQGHRYLTGHHRGSWYTRVERWRGRRPTCGGDVWPTARLECASMMLDNHIAAIRAKRRVFEERQEYMKTASEVAQRNRCSTCNYYPVDGVIFKGRLCQTCYLKRHGGVVV